jgi:hypothetical protein
MARNRSKEPLSLWITAATVEEMDTPVQDESGKIVKAVQITISGERLQGGPFETVIGMASETLDGIISHLKRTM